MHSDRVVLQDLIERFRVPDDRRIRLRDYDPAWAGDEKVPKAQRKQFAEEVLADSIAALAGAQELLYASDSYALLIVLQAMDAAGKDGIVKHVMSGVNPLACQAYSFKQPSAEELDHNFLWRCSKAVPERGRIGIFNRSYFEEVLIVKVHPELVAKQRLPGAKVNKEFWQARYDDINAFERHLTRNGTVILKFFLHVSKQEQRQRLLERMNDPNKHWKVSPGDVHERSFWDDYMQAYEDALNATSTKWAPWYIVPADYKWVSRAFVAQVIATTIKGLNLRYPEVTPAQRREIEAARQALENEKD